MINDIGERVTPVKYWYCWTLFLLVKKNAFYIIPQKT